MQSQNPDQWHLAFGVRSVKEENDPMHRTKLAEKGGNRHQQCWQQGVCKPASRPSLRCRLVPIHNRGTCNHCWAKCDSRFDRSSHSTVQVSFTSTNMTLKTHLWQYIVPLHTIDLTEKGLFAFVFCIGWKMCSCSSASARSPVHNTFEE